MSVSIPWHRSKLNWPTAAFPHLFGVLVAGTWLRDALLIFWVHWGPSVLNTSNNIHLVSKMKMLLGDTEWETRWAFVGLRRLKNPHCVAHSGSFNALPLEVWKPRPLNPNRVRTFNFIWTSGGRRWLKRCLIPLLVFAKPKPTSHQSSAGLQAASQGPTQLETTCPSSGCPERPTPRCCLKTTTCPPALPSGRDVDLFQTPTRPPAQRP